jgi:hypothetical protein
VIWPPRPGALKGRTVRPEPLDPALQEISDDDWPVVRESLTGRLVRGAGAPACA